MAGITIGLSPVLRGTPADTWSAGTTGGSAAEQVYQRAAKQLENAQRKLTSDLKDHAAEEIIRLDQQSVELAMAQLQLPPPLWRASSVTSPRLSPQAAHHRRPQSAAS